MAQIFGYYSAAPLENVALHVAGMGHNMRRPTQTTVDFVCDDLGGIGAVLERERGAFKQLVVSSKEYIIAIDGTPELDGRKTNNAEETLIERYQRMGARFVSTLRGSFCIALFDRTNRTLLLATDRLSSRSLFWARVPHGLGFSTELKGLLALPQLQIAPDVKSIGLYLRYGRLFGSRTMCRGVSLLLPGQILVYKLDDDSVENHCSFEAQATISRREPLNSQRLTDLADAFKHAVLNESNGESKVGLSVSGGLDSRGILAVLAAKKSNAVLRTEGMEGCLDAVIGRKLAATTGIPWSFQPLTECAIGSYVEAMRRYVYLTEGMTVPEGFPGVGPLEFAAQEQLHKLQRGHGGENARVRDAWPFQVNETVLRFKSRGDFYEYLETPYQAHSPILDGLVCGDDFATAVSEPENSLSAFADQIDHSLTPAETMSVLYLQIADGRQVTAFRNCLRGYTDMALPYLDDAFLDLVLSTRVADRCSETIHYHLIRANCPALMRVANSNHGASLDATAIRRLITEKAYSLARKLRIPGFRHYHYVEKWLQTLLRDQIRAVLLDPRTERRGVFNPKRVRTLLDNPGQPGHSRLLARLTMIEMWLRLFIDKEISDYTLSLDAA
jgi:asparagine synthase (glutamine-hydrolysing)